MPFLHRRPKGPAAESVPADLDALKHVSGQMGLTLCSRDDVSGFAATDAFDRALGLVAFGHRAACHVDVDDVGQLQTRLAHACQTRMPVVVWAVSSPEASSSETSSSEASSSEASSSEASSSETSSSEASSSEASPLGDVLGLMASGTAILVAPDAASGSALVIAAQRAAESALWPVLVVLSPSAGAKTTVWPDATVSELLPTRVAPLAGHQSLLWTGERDSIPARLSPSNPLGIGPHISGRDQFVQAATSAITGDIELGRALDEALGLVSERSGIALAPVVRSAPRRPRGRLVVPASITPSCPTLDVHRVVRLAPAVRDLAQETTVVFAAPAPHSMLESWRGTAGARVASIGWGRFAPDDAAWGRFERAVVDDTLPDRSVIGLVAASTRPLPPEAERQKQFVYSAYPELDAALVGDATNHQLGSEVQGRVPDHIPDSADPNVHTGPPLFDPAYFWRSIGHMRRAGRESELSSDPYAAFGAVPPRTAEMTAAVDNQEMIPRMLAERCTGCGSCWSICPDSALTVGAAGSTELLGHAIDHTESKDGPLAMLKRLAPALAQSMDRLQKKDGLNQYLSVHAVINESFDRLVARAELTEGDLTTLREDLDRVVAALPDLATARVFSSGRILSISADPDRCTGCGLCVSFCPEQALESVPPGDRDEAKWHADTTSALAVRPDDVDELIHAGWPAGLLADPLATDVAVGGHGTPGERLVLRLITSVTAAEIGRSRGRLAVRARDAVAALDASTTQVMQAAAKISDFDAFSEQLQSIGPELASLAAAGGAAPLKEERLKALADARADVLAQSPRGDVPLVVLFHESMSAPQYPDNPYAFSWMAAAEPGTAVAVADELRSQASATCTAILAAEQEARDTRDETAVDPDPLDVPAILYVTRTLTPAVLRLLAGSRPVRVVLLTDDPLADSVSTFGAGLAAGVFTAQVSPSRTGPMIESVRAALSCKGPALLSVLVPTGSTEKLLERCDLAVSTRAFPLFQLDGNLELSANPASTDRWSADQTPAHWAAGSDRFRPSFFPLRKHASPEGSRPHAEVLDGLDGVPIIRLDANHVARVPDGVHEASRRRMTEWDRLRSLAGILGESGSAAPTGVSRASVAGAAASGEGASEADGRAEGTGAPDLGTKDSSERRPAPAAVPADALHTLTERLLVLSGFDAGTTKGSMRLAELTNEDGS